MSFPFRSLDQPAAPLTLLVNGAILFSWFLCCHLASIALGPHQAKICDWLSYHSLWPTKESHHWSFCKEAGSPHTSKLLTALVNEVSSWLSYEIYSSVGQMWHSSGPLPLAHSPGRKTPQRPPSHLREWCCFRPVYQLPLASLSLFLPLVFATQTFSFSLARFLQASRCHPKSLFLAQGSLPRCYILCPTRMPPSKFILAYIVLYSSHHDQAPPKSSHWGPPVDSRDMLILTAPLGCNLFPLALALPCHHRLCWTLSIIIILASRGQVGSLLKVACAYCGTKASVVSSCLGDVLAPDKEWWATSAGSEVLRESVEQKFSGALMQMLPYWP